MLERFSLDREFGFVFKEMVVFHERKIGQINQNANLADIVGFASKTSPKKVFEAK